MSHTAEIAQPVVSFVCFLGTPSSELLPSQCGRHICKCAPFPIYQGQQQFRDMQLRHEWRHIRCTGSAHNGLGVLFLRSFSHVNDHVHRTRITSASSRPSGSFASSFGPPPPYRHTSDPIPPSIHSCLYLIRTPPHLPVRYFRVISVPAKCGVIQCDNNLLFSKCL